MAFQVFLTNRKTGKRYRVLGERHLKNNQKLIRLQGDWSEFEEPFNKQWFKDNGYFMERIEVPDEVPVEGTGPGA